MFKLTRKLNTSKATLDTSQTVSTKKDKYTGLPLCGG